MASGRASLARPGSISGSGLASARMIGRGAIALTISTVRTPGAERPRKTSASGMTSARVRAAVSIAKAAFCGLISLIRPLWMTPSTSTRTIFSRFNPISTIKLRQAIPAAPPPVDTIRMSPISLPTTRRALRKAAPATMAVPCWSSWKTGMFMRALNAASTWKHSGARMSSRLMAPKVGSRAAMISARRSGSVSLISISNTSMPANCLNRTALPSITGLAANGPILPRPRTAEPFVITATRLARTVRLAASAGSSTMARQAAATPGE